jgi:hypothetical protein
VSDATDRVDGGTDAESMPGIELKPWIMAR